MGTLKIGINGFGRIGRLSLRALLERDGTEVVAINDLTDTATLAHLFKYDSAHGLFNGDIAYDENNLIINGEKILVLKEKDPAKLNWKNTGAAIILESTGRFRSKEKASAHLTAGAKKVVISAYASGGVKTIVLGVNENELQPEDKIISNASCTTNCLALMVKVLDDTFGIEHGQMTTVHAYTSSQQLHDAPNRDLRRSRAAAVSIIPTTTSATKAIGEVLPHLNGKLTGTAMRIPVLTGSITDFTAVLKKKVTKEDINAAMKNAAVGAMKKVLQYSEEPLVSVDIISNPHSCIFDAKLTSVVDDNLVKVFGWYDNESGYAHRIADLLEKMGAIS